MCVAHAVRRKRAGKQRPLPVSHGIALSHQHRLSRRAQNEGSAM